MNVEISFITNMMSFRCLQNAKWSHSADSVVYESDSQKEASNWRYRIESWQNTGVC